MQARGLSVLPIGPKSSSWWSSPLLLRSLQLTIWVGPDARGQGNERFHPHTRGDNAEFPGLGDPVADLLCPVWRQLPRYNGIPMLAHEYNDHP